MTSYFQRLDHCSFKCYEIALRCLCIPSTIGCLVFQESSFIYVVQDYHPLVLCGESLNCSVSSLLGCKHTKYPCFASTSFRLPNVLVLISSQLDTSAEILY